jgi:hypothetical protein
MPVNGAAGQPADTCVNDADRETVIETSRVIWARGPLRCGCCQLLASVVVELDVGSGQVLL